MTDVTFQKKSDQRYFVDQNYFEIIVVGVDADVEFVVVDETDDHDFQKLFDFHDFEDPLFSFLIIDDRSKLLMFTLFSWYI